MYNGIQEAFLDYSIKIGGEAGQGIQTIGDTLSKVFSRSGYHVFTHQDYESRVRGGHNFYQIRLSDVPITASRTKIDIVVALDKESVILHERELSEKVMIIYDSASLKEKYERPNFLDVPFAGIALDVGGDRIMANTVATGAVLGMLGMNIDIFSEVLKETLSKKSEEVIKTNEKAALAGMGYANTNCMSCDFSIAPPASKKMLIGVNEAVGLGAIASGLKFYSGYPMTPSTGIMTYVAGKAMEYGIIVEQAEDEISAINMALGASYAGVRSMTGSSGGGFALMVEGLSLAAMTETPIVIALAQRPAPATGLPTRTEQADLLFALYSGHGEFPRVIFAPGTPEQAFYLTNRAFEISQKYQIPVFILTDQYLSDAQWTYSNLDLDRLIYNDYRLRGDAFASLSEYKRHVITENGVSPFGVPGEAKHVVVTDSDEHDEEGHLIEDGETRIQMVIKRLFQKLVYLRRDINPPSFYGSENPEIIITGWGSTYGVMKDAVDILSKNKSIAMLHFSEVFPFPETDTWLDVLMNARFAVCVENNATGQFARLVKSETGYVFNAIINRFDGRPFLAEELMGELDGYIGRL
ncbi:MAG: 2-oxoacid:acceptor oxidoreductase subunit alpha [Proteobacteria bacterium]|nr:2-oxoacid:acceptor oxidoreductase subunit alpha [Pseudomonadota bacterium]